MRKQLKIGTFLQRISPMNKNKYPRVLIIGEQFDHLTGGGITLSNLFADWPRECLAFAHHRTPTPETRKGASSFYLLGREEIIIPWPMSKYSKLSASGPVHCDSAFCSENIAAQPTTSRKRGLLWKILVKSVQQLGLQEFLTRQSPSPLFLSWVRAFSPDLVYVQLGSLGSIQFNNTLAEKLGLSFVVHIMDDWPVYMYARCLAGPLLRPIMSREFDKFLRYSVIRLGICQAMCDEYEKRFGGKWLSFHNPVDLNKWQVISRKKWKSDTIPFRILYSGRIGRGISQSIVDIAKVVSGLAKDGMDIEFLIRTADLAADVTAVLRGMNAVRVESFLPFNKVPESLAKADLLVIPYDFDPYSVLCSKYSMPTKTAEYMVCGTPTLVYAPNDFAISHYARSEGWGYTVTANTSDKLREAIKSLATDEGLREQLGRRAMELAARNHDALLIRENFNQVLKCDDTSLKN